MVDYDTYVIIGSGPSLTTGQVEYLREHGHHTSTIAVNDNYKLAPWCDFVFASDLKWWRLYYDDVCDTVELYTELRTIENVTKPLFKNRKGKIRKTLHWDYVFRDVELISVNPLALYHGGCSGILAMEFVRSLGEVHKPKKIILVGFDMHHSGGKSHWFGDHPKGFINANMCERWCSEIENMMPYYKQWDIDVVNCSLETAIPEHAVRRSTLEEEL